MKPNPLAKLIGKKIVHQCPGVKWEGHHRTFTLDAREVILMAVSGNYAMVRRKGAMPYVAPINELHE